MGDVPAAEIIQRDFKDYELPQPSANAHRPSQPVDPSAMVKKSQEIQGGNVGSRRTRVRSGFAKWRGESRRRASYSTTMSLPDTDTAPRPRGQTFVSILNVVPSPGILAKICWGPRTICPFSTS